MKKKVERNMRATRPKRYSLRTLAGWFKKVFVDKRFQRPLAWTQENKDGYMRSVLLDKGNNNFVFADNKACLEFSIEHDSEISQKYFEDVSATHDYTSVDGNNRLNTVFDYLHGDLEIDFGGIRYDLEDYDNEDADVISHVLYKHKFVDLPSDVKDWLENRMMTVEFLMGASREDCHDKFRNINNNVPLTAQELRTAIICDFSQFVLDLVKEHEFISDKIVKLSLKGRKLDEFIVACLVFLGSDEISSIGKKDYDAPYWDGDESLTFSKRKKSRKILREALKLYKSGDLKNEIDGIHLLFNWVMFYGSLRNNKVEIQNGKKLFKLFLAAQNELKNDFTSIFQDSKQEYHFMGCCSAFNKGKMEARLSVLNEKIFNLSEFNDCIRHEGDVEEEQETYTGDRDPQRNFSASQRLDMWFAQGGKLTSIVEGNLVEGCDATCNLSEEKIPYSEIQNGSKWEADHIIPWSKGGRTISENGQLIAKRFNRAKSDSVDFVEEIGEELEIA